MGGLIKQNPQLPNIVGECSAGIHNMSSRWANGAFRLNLSSQYRGSGADQGGQSGFYFDSSYEGASADIDGHNVYVENGEVRTSNYTKRIWKRIS